MLTFNRTIKNMFPNRVRQPIAYYSYYKHTVELLFSIENFSDRSRQTEASKGHNSKEELDHYCQILNLNSDLKLLPTIHVAGTKGKGSTCSLAESILRSMGYQTGLFTSPHLLTPRERIRLNGQNISKEEFVELFWKLHTRLSANKTKPFPYLPSFFRYLTLMSLYAFTKKQTEASIVEVGIGGRYDSTNIVHPDVCGITTLDYDHTSILGDTLEEIAWEKAGIIKGGVPVYVSPQPEGPMKVITDYAKKMQAPIQIIPQLHDLVSAWESKLKEGNQPIEQYYQNGKNFQLSLQGNHQKINAALAISLVVQFLKSRKGFVDDVFSKCITLPNKRNPEKALLNSQVKTIESTQKISQMIPHFIHGLENCVWNGRCQIETDKEYKNDRVKWFLDGAHTEKSISHAIEWFHSKVSKGQEKCLNILLFSCTAGRNPELFYKSITNKNVIDIAIFVPTMKDVFTSETLKQMKILWDRFPQNQNNPSIQLDSLADGIQQISKIANSGNKNINIFVTGSLHLVGDVLKLKNFVQGD
ncbi:folylpolyglutamate synthase [Anaeramoeba flamelloides]|uniref:tetrahydrofolate synthase n=1 Tax=Anaeramoeba flamelloides TaxID=1746091 RepID=A0ABQ8YW80_9EUKA|nr:folylpolyglutamate synthase [Anaeramoeba flamelloides]